MTAAAPAQKSLEFGLLTIEDPELRQSLLWAFEYARERAESGEVSCVLLAARRLACVYQALLSMGFDPIPCPVVSDRVLDLESSSDLDAGKVLIIDDCMILGKTAARLINRVRESADDSRAVECVVVCGQKGVGSEQTADAHGIKVASWRPQSGVRTFALNLSQLLFENQIPYFTDFPSTKPLELPPGFLSRLLTVQGWRPVETTAILLWEAGLSSYSLVPDDNIRQRVEDRLGPAISSVLSLLKLRVIASSSNFGDRVVLVPLALLKPMTSHSVDNILEALANELKEREVFKTDWRDWNHDAKYRTLQMFCSVVLLQEFLADSSDNDRNAFDFGPDLIDPSLFSLHFGSERVEALRTAVAASAGYSASSAVLREPVQGAPTLGPSSVEQEPGALLLRKACAELYKRVDLPVLPGVGEIARTGATFVVPMAQVFGYVGDLEDRYRETFSTANEDVSAGLRWLDDGVTLSWLAGSLDGELGQGHDELLTSLALDTLNDLGIAVPTTVHDEDSDLIYRRYRIGENVQLANVWSHSKLKSERWAADGRSWLVRTFLSSVTAVAKPAQAVSPLDRPDVLSHLQEFVMERKRAVYVGEN